MPNDPSDKSTEETIARSKSRPPANACDVDELGRGGWGVVQHAIDRQLERPVAIKSIVPSRSVTESVRERFLHEAKVTSQLQHPGIVPVHELHDDQEGGAYYVMKLLSGQPLRQLIRETHSSISKSGSDRRPLTLRDAILPLLERFIDVCEAVAYAHEQGVLHRDLKPANVMIGQFGETIVVDWGLAKRLRDPTAVRNEVEIAGDLDQAQATLERSDTDAARTSAGSIITWSKLVSCIRRPSSRKSYQPSSTRWRRAFRG